MLSQSLGMLLLICLPIVALEVLAAPQLAGLFLGQAYAPAGAAIMPIVAIAILLQGRRGFRLDIAVHLARRTRALIGLWALAAGANVVLNLILIPRLGLLGAAWATLLAHMLAVSYFLLRVPRPAVLGLPVIDLMKIASVILVFAVLLAPVWVYLDGAWVPRWGRYRQPCLRLTLLVAQPQPTSGPPPSTASGLPLVPSWWC